MHNAGKAFGQSLHKPIAVEGRDVGSARYRDNPFHFTNLKAIKRADLGLTLCYILQDKGLEFKIFSAKKGYFAV